MPEGLIIIPVLVIGVVLGLYELFLIHGDMSFRGSHWFGHGLHAVGLMIVALFATMNTEYFLEITGLIDSGIPLIGSPLAVRIAIGLILNIKMHATSSAIRGGGMAAARGMAEHWTHTILISALVVLAPYIWPYVAPMIPSYLGGLA